MLSSRSSLALRVSRLARTRSPVQELVKDGVRKALGNPVVVPVPKLCRCRIKYEPVREAILCGEFAEG
jgi:hypothetical protein